VSTLQGQAPLTDNRRIPLQREFAREELVGPIDLRDGSRVPALLYVLKNGGAVERSQYRLIEEAFHRLTGRDLGLRVELPVAADPRGQLTVIEPTILEGDTEIPLEFCGAGRQEALVLATLLVGEPGRVFVLDEPAVNVEPTMQRRLISELRNVGQCLVITHSPDLVPVESTEDMNAIVRLAPGTHGAKVCKPMFLDEDTRIRWLKLLDPSHVRALLFAARVILFEGTTELGALPRWWSESGCDDLPTPQATNTAIVDVGGHKGYGAYVGYLEAFQIPWAIVCDGPALASNSDLANQLRKAQLAPDGEPEDPRDFPVWKAYWERAGVFTLATTFGDDGSKSGEFEALLQSIDSEGYEAAVRTAGRSKPRRGLMFALDHEPPAQAIKLYRDITTHFR
jgi:hypothetical protein